MGHVYKTNAIVESQEVDLFTPVEVRKASDGRGYVIEWGGELFVERTKKRAENKSLKIILKELEKLDPEEILASVRYNLRCKADIYVESYPTCVPKSPSDYP